MNQIIFDLKNGRKYFPMATSDGDKLLKLMDSIPVTIFMFLITLWSLFGDDIRLSATSKSADVAFLGLISAIFFIFIFEIFIQTFFKPDYCTVPRWTSLPDETAFKLWARRLSFGSFYFWLDVIATASIISEITWISGDTFTSGDQQTYQADSSKVIRVIRTVRLVRLIKLSKYFQKKNEKKDEIQESNVGAAMSELTARRVVILVLFMVLISPLLQYEAKDYSYTIAVKLAHRMARSAIADPILYTGGLNRTITHLIDNAPIIFVSFNGKTFYEDPTKMDALRAGSEKITYKYDDDVLLTMVSFDTQVTSVEDALFSIYTTLFIAFLLLFGTVMFSSDVKKLVVGPIEQMVVLVRKISTNPLGVEYVMLGEEDGFLPGMETTTILSTIIKIGGLLKVGFGEAGADVIAKNLAGPAGKLNFLGAGNTIKSIFGFCDVRQFTDTTECLQEEVMLFVNRIAHILHSIVVQCSGAANKNIGDAFLLTWKLDPSLSAEQITRLADQALLCFSKTLIELVRYEEFIMNFSSAAMTRLYKRFPEYKVRIGSGLHVGWAIEGAIGSDHKIDASYLSPHVNFTEYLESSTKAYGVPLLISENFFRLLSKEAAKNCRQVDRIRKSDDEEPIGIYAYDADLTVDFPHIIPASKRPHRHHHKVTPPKGSNNWNPIPSDKDENATTVRSFRGQSSNRVDMSVRRSVRRDRSNQGSQRRSNKLDNEHPPFAGITSKKSDDDLIPVPSQLGFIPQRPSTQEWERPPTREKEHPSMTNESSTRRNSAFGAEALSFSRRKSDGKTEVSLRRKSGSGANSLKKLNNELSSSVRSKVGSDRPSQRLGSGQVVPVNDDDLEAGHRVNHKENFKTTEKPPVDVAPDIFIRTYKESVWRQDFDLITLRAKFDALDIKEAWEDAIADYIAGNWDDCLSTLNDIAAVADGKDGPTNFLLEFIGSHGGIAPSDWKGYRDESGGH